MAPYHTTSNFLDHTKCVVVWTIQSSHKEGVIIVSEPPQNISRLAADCPIYPIVTLGRNSSKEFPAIYTLFI